MQAIGYIRVSTERQAEEGVSLEAQRAKIEAYCTLHDYELVTIHEDAGISGKSMEKRQGLQHALADAKKGMVLVVYSLSRLARSTKDCIEIAETLKAKGCGLVSLTEKIDTVSAMGEFFFTLMAALGQMERKMIGERTKAALGHKKANGEVYTAVIPFGFQAIEGRLERVEAEARIVSEIQAMRQSGTTLQAIANHLNTQGIAGKQGGKWYPSTVRGILQREAA